MAKRIDKPIRLTVITIFIVIAYGIFPIFSAFPVGRELLLVGPNFLPLNGSILALYSGDGEISVILLVVTLALLVLTLTSTIVAFLGVREGRAATLLFLTLNLLWWYLLIISAITFSESSVASLGLVLELIMPPFWAAFVWWNMTRPDIADWLDYQESLESSV